MNEGAARDFSGHPLLADDEGSHELVREHELEHEQVDADQQQESRRISRSSRLSGQRSADPHDYSKDSDFSNNNMSDDD
jgi:hypothetical protein